MLKKIIATGGCLALALTLVACGERASDNTGAEIAPSATATAEKTVSFKGLQLTMPSDWTEEDGDYDNKYYYPPNWGYFYLTSVDLGPFKSGVILALDEYNKDFSDFFTSNGGEFDLSNERSTYEGIVRTFTYDLILKKPDSPEFKGTLKHFVSGNDVFTLVGLVEKTSYEEHQPSIRQVIDSARVSNPEPPNAAGDNISPTTSDTEQVPATTTPPAVTIQKKIYEGTYKVGTDIEPGEYKLTVTRSSSGYWEVTDSSAADADIVGNDIFSSSTYVTVTEGQYLKLSGCTAEKVQ